MHADVRHRPRDDGGPNYCRDPSGPRRLVESQFRSGRGRAVGASRVQHRWASDDGGGAAMSTEVQHAEPGIFQKYFWSTDHKMIAKQYLFTGMAMAMIGGFFAYVFRMQQGFPNQYVPGFGLVTPGRYN